METYKDVIVSHPPAMYSQSGHTTHFALENYKGILLCQRPSNLGSAAGFGGAGGADGYDRGNASSAPFVPSKPTGNPLGYGPSKESRDARAEQEALRVANQRQRQTKSSQALSRHRRWLRSFARQVQSMKESDRQLEVEAAQRAARVREAEKRRRAEQQQELAAIAVSTDNASAPPYNMHKSMEAHVATTLKGTAAPVAPSSRKPKWALTEEEAMDAELDFDRDLLDFAENLDYEKFISDFEVAEALGVMRDRVEEIARANNWSVDDIRRATTDDDDDLNSVVSPSEAHLILCSKQRQQQGGGAAAAEARAALPEALAVHAHDWDSSSSGRGRLLKKAISRDALALAERLFAASPSLQKVHTRHSLARALQRCALEGRVDVTESTLLRHASKPSAAKGGGGANSDAASSSPAAVDPPAIPEPLVVKIGADAMPAPCSSADGFTGGSAAGIQPSRILRELQQSKERTQGLPYLYRCPAI
ncbi:hypothetical protein, conserved [Leishmania donovani]|uniref:Uncharacterized protein n=1 Tax=Leishmania donovani TaxID=5661 RepID=E9BC71_LEIDO|nr:hypothetical protein, conserved [Leishmania donovani]AYU77441.1 hypothetical protein LdCL_150007900 [Leishmania donovani]CBZ32847.1 hypothetical protein, conserved [Leishmania donovani]